MITVETYRETYEYKDAESFEVKDYNLLVKDSAGKVIAAFSGWSNVHVGSVKASISRVKDEFVSAHMNLPEDDDGSA